MEYLGHIVGKDGVLVDPKKIETMQDWPHPKNVRDLNPHVDRIIYFHVIKVKINKA
jgi:hypothetical protein